MGDNHGSASGPAPSPQSPRQQLSFSNHCFLCLQPEQLQMILELERGNLKLSKDFQSIIHYLTGTDPTYATSKWECDTKGIPVMANVPPLCSSCYGILAELYRLHTQLLNIRWLIQKQAEYKLKNKREVVTKTIKSPAVLQLEKVVNTVIEFVDNVRIRIVRKGDKVTFPGWELSRLHAQLLSIQGLIQKQTELARAVVTKTLSKPAEPPSHMSLLWPSYSQREIFHHRMEISGMPPEQISTVVRFVDNVHNLIISGGVYKVTFPSMVPLDFVPTPSVVAQHQPKIPVPGSKPSTEYSIPFPVLCTSTSASTTARTPSILKSAPTIPDFQPASAVGTVKNSELITIKPRIQLMDSTDSSSSSNFEVEDYQVKEELEDDPAVITGDIIFSPEGSEDDGDEDEQMTDFEASSPAPSKSKRKQSFESGLIQCTVQEHDATNSVQFSASPIIPTNSQDIKFRCKLCDRAYKNASGLKRHMKIHNNGEKPNSCEECRLQFHDHIWLDYHRRKVHPGERPRPYRCDDCGIAFILSSNLKRHMKRKMHKGDPKLLKNLDNLEHQNSQECDLCGKLIPLMNIVEHLESHHVKDFITKCPNPTCQRAFSCDGKMHQHLMGKGSRSRNCRIAINLPAGPPRIKCDICKVETRGKHNYRLHIRKHEYYLKEKMLSCPLPDCRERYALRKSLEHHIMTHDLRP